jgi:hypothetical protein
VHIELPQELGDGRDRRDVFRTFRLGRVRHPACMPAVTRWQTPTRWFSKPCGTFVVYVTVIAHWRGDV